MLATIWTNFCHHPCPAVHMSGRTDTFLGAQIFGRGYLRHFLTDCDEIWVG